MKFRSKQLALAPRTSILKQRGVVLFFALLALVVMSLAAVALIRSVDTSTMIAGNLAFKQSATTAGDEGIETAITWLATTDAANSGLNVLMNPAHAFNNDNAASGYYSSADPSLNLTSCPLLASCIHWDATDSCGTGANCAANTDAAGNTVRYVIQRMCRNRNQAISTADCLFSGATQDNNNQSIPLPQQICVGPGCPAVGQTPQIRITARITGPRNTVSYIQSFVY